MNTYEDVKRAVKDAQTRAYCKHLISARNKWHKEADEREKMENAADVNHDWSTRARAHANKLDKELEKILGKEGLLCCHGHKLGTPAGDMHRGCARMGTV